MNVGGCPSLQIQAFYTQRQSGVNRQQDVNLPPRIQPYDDLKKYHQSVYSYSYFVLYASGPLTNTNTKWCVISGFRYKVAEKRAFLGYYVASSGSTAPRVITQKSTVPIKWHATPAIYNQKSWLLFTFEPGCYFSFCAWLMKNILLEQKKKIEINASAMNKTDYAANLKNAVNFLAA